MENDIVLVKDISSSIDALDKKIDDIGNDNIINHSTIKDIEEDIARINKKIKNIDNKNRKRISIKNIKIFGTLIRLVLPYVVVSGLLFGVFAIFGDIPFVRQQQLKIAERKIVMETKSDNSASKNSYKSYVVKDSGEQDNTASVVETTKWEKKADGYYYRAVTTYYFDDQSFIDPLIKNLENKDVTDKFEGIKSRGTSTQYEKKSPKDLTDADLAKDSTIKLVYHTHDESDFIIEAQSSSQNTGGSIAYLLGAAILLFGTWGFRMEMSDFEFFETIKLIKERYPNIDIEELKKVFKDTKIKFKRVQKEQVSLIDPIDNKRSIIRGK